VLEEDEGVAPARTVFDGSEPKIAEIGGRDGGDLLLHGHRFVTQSMSTAATPDCSITAQTGYCDGNVQEHGLCSRDASGRPCTLS
jgi:hypothetical protein